MKLVCEKIRRQLYDVVKRFAFDLARFVFRAPGGQLDASRPNSGVPVTGADLRAAQKELSAIERKLERLTQRTAEIHERMAAHDQSDFAGLTRLGDELREVETETASLEERWFELTELAT